MDSSIIARDVGLEKADENSDGWTNRAFLNVSNYLRVIKKDVGEFTGEQLRHMLLPTVGEPPSPGCMGALTMRLVKSKVIEKTGKHTYTKDEQSHGRETKLYIWAKK